LKLEEKSAKKLDTWQGGGLSYGGRTILINAILINSSIYHMSMFLMPKTTTKNLGKQRRKFFWQGGSKKKYHLIKWTKICKEEEGGGIKNLRKMNISLLCKWWWILENENGLWQELVKLKYVHDSPVCLIKPKMNDSPCWKD
jgi:hypothetical protein